jgi:AraC family L-rhamnose operon regulatory protein RhaS
MNPTRQHELLAVQQLDTSRWPFPSHTHNHFELILIRSGSGYHSINGNQSRYEAGAIYLLGPLDCHTFVIDSQTSFSRLAFTDLYLAELTTADSDAWPQIRQLGYAKNHLLVGSIVTDPTEQQNLTALIDIILAEQANHRQLASSQIVGSLMKTILSLVDRQLAQRQVKANVGGGTTVLLMQRISAYICQHITRPDFLRVEKIADIFNYSPGHLSALFKQQAGESIQQYIIRYKLQLVERRLRSSAMTIGQIADEFGFTDICHLNKLFKQHYRRTPSYYRRELTMNPAT